MMRASDIGKYEIVSAEVLTKYTDHLYLISILYACTKNYISGL